MHASHRKVIVRLKRTLGHLQSVIGMIEAERNCLEVAQQLEAVFSALQSAKTTYVQDHIDHCFEDEVLARGKKGVKASISELKAICKYL